jgi:hypothetical protein
LYVDGQWIIYPMEVRVVSAVVPGHKRIEVPLAPITQPVDATARAAVRTYLCGAARSEPAPEGNIRWFVLRDVSQELALARVKESSPGSRLLPIIAKGTEPATVGKWCESPVWPEDLGPEWFLRVRDSLYREY